LKLKIVLGDVFTLKDAAQVVPESELLGPHYIWVFGDWLIGLCVSHLKDFPVLPYILDSTIKEAVDVVL
jgi:hypothetical protein